MPSITVARTINAPVDRVFAAVADVRNFSEAVPQIVNIEFLTDQQVGVGTRFRETRLMKGKEASTELEVTEYEENQHVRIVADSHGTVWDTVFTTEENSAGATELTMVMDARAHKLLPKLMNPLIMKMIAGLVAKDLDCVKAYCERG